ncbi:S8 family serine peptidase [Actinoplanes sp. NPDC049802]|uniref:S8 family peptidase n=1 Tax=Actinoplanes sp. NPDC049802 TaxID=3154742 RepID=UPI00341008CD
MRKWTLGTMLTAALAASALAAPAQAASAQGRYIVTLKTGGHRLDVGRRLRDFRTIPGFVAEMTAAQARELAADPAVRHVEPDRIMSLAGKPTDPAWGLDRVDQRGATLSGSYLPSADGDSVHAYVIDTGIRISHQEFGGRAAYGHDFVGDDATASDCNGHGTHVAGTIGGTRYGVAKKVSLVAVRVLNCRGEGYLSDIIDGVGWVTANAVRPAVANMSLGGGHSPSLDAAVRDSIASGVTYVVAGGNEDADVSRVSPARVTQAVTVAASDVRDRRASFSNFGKGVDLFAPGVNILSATAGGDTATDRYSGTSMASPHVAGAAALLLDADPALTPARVQARLIADATTGRITDRAGSPNRLLHVPPPPAVPVIATGRTGDAEVGVAYSARLTLAGARRGAWSLAGGELPAGLGLSADGVLSGVPEVAGEHVVTVRFTDYVPQSVTARVVVPVAAHQSSAAAYF